eukprot:GHVP01046553.1.p1 GENE.GHVP01046553.1~~GHVP01046553.1.p1  ORF type:complete len:351 (+),score=68.82 GHVP01046553.1:84-1136(+)
MSVVTMHESDKEPLLDENWERWVSFPIVHNDSWEWYKKLESEFYSSSYFNISGEKSIFDENSPKIKAFLTSAVEDNLLIDKLLKSQFTENLISAVQLPEVRSYLAMQSAIETIHCEVFSSLLDAWSGNKPNEVEIRLKNLISKGEIFGLRKEFCDKYMSHVSDTTSPECGFAQALIAAICTDTIFRVSLVFGLDFPASPISSSPNFKEFCTRMTSDLQISSDHAGFLYHWKLKNRKLSKDKIRMIVEEAVLIEKEVANLNEAATLFSGETKGQSDLLIFIENIADQILESLGLDTIYRDQDGIHMSLKQKWKGLQGPKSLILEPQTTTKKNNTNDKSKEHEKTFSMDEDF